MNNPPDHKGILSRSILHLPVVTIWIVEPTIFIAQIFSSALSSSNTLLSVSLVVFLSLLTIRKESGSLFVVFYFDCSTIESLCGWFPLVTEIDVGLDVMAKVIQCTLLLRSFILLLSAKV